MASDPKPIRSLPQPERVYRFGKDLDGNVVLTRGWGEPERGFVWSEGKAAVVSLPALPGPNSISISLWGYVPAGDAAQEILIFINGSLQGFFEIHEKTILKIPYHHEGPSDILNLLFYLPAAKSPQVAEGLDDRRQLGIALASIQVCGNLISSTER